MEECKKVYQILDELNIPFNIVEHPAVLTTEEADAYIEGMEGVCSKSLFLCDNKKRNYFLLIMDDKKRLDIKKLGETIGEKGIRFAPEEKLMEKLGLKPGLVSIFGILNNEQRDVKIYIDKEIHTEELINFHPNDNTKTIFISVKDMYKFINNVGYECNEINL